MITHRARGGPGMHGAAGGAEGGATALQYPASCVVAVAPHGADLHLGAGGVDHLPVADVDAHVLDRAVVEDEVSDLELVAGRPACRSRTACGWSEAEIRPPWRTRTARARNSRSPWGWPLPIRRALRGTAWRRRPPSQVWRRRTALAAFASAARLGLPCRFFLLELREQGLLALERLILLRQLIEHLLLSRRRSGPRSLACCPTGSPARPAFAPSRLGMPAPA